MAGRRRPPPPTAHRAARRPLVFEYLRRWHSRPGLDPFERERLRQLGYATWLERGRITAPMTVALLLYTLDDLYYFAAERPVHRADLRGRMIEALQRRRTRPTGLTDEEQALGRALVKLEQVVMDAHGPLFSYDPSTGSVRPAPESTKVTKAWQAIQQRWPKETTQLQVEVVQHLSTDVKLRTTPPRRSNCAENWATDSSAPTRPRTTAPSASASGSSLAFTSTRRRAPSTSRH